MSSLRLSKDAQKLFKVAAPIVLTNNLISLGQRPDRKQSARYQKDKTAKSPRMEQMTNCFLKIAKALTFFAGYEGMLRLISHLGLQSTKREKLLKAVVVFFLHLKMKSFPWGISIYIFFRSFFARASTGSSVNAKRFVKFLVSPAGIFLYNLFHSHLMAHHARLMAPGYIKLWLSVNDEYKNRKDGSKYGLAQYHSEFDEASCKDGCYQDSHVNAKRFRNLPNNTFKSFKKQAFIFFTLYMLGFAAGSQTLAKRINAAIAQKGLKSTKAAVFGTNMLLKEILGLLRKTTKSAFTLTIMSFGAIDFGVVYANLVKKFRSTSTPEDQKVKKNYLAQMLFTASIAALSLQIENPGRRAVLVSYLHWRNLEGLLRASVFEITEKGQAVDVYGIGNLLASSFMAFSAAMCL